MVIKKITEDRTIPIKVGNRNSLENLARTGLRSLARFVVVLMTG
jgi:hypothetical protein